MAFAGEMPAYTYTYLLFHLLSGCSGWDALRISRARVGPDRCQLAGSLLLRFQRRSCVLCVENPINVIDSRLWKARWRSAVKEVLASVTVQQSPIVGRPAGIGPFCCPRRVVSARPPKCAVPPVRKLCLCRAAFISGVGSCSASGPL